MKINDLDKAVTNGTETVLDAVSGLADEMRPNEDATDALAQLGMMYMQRVSPALDEWLEARIGKAKLDEFKRLTGIIKKGKHKPKAGNNGATRRY